MSKDTPKAYFTPRLTADTGMVARCCRLVRELEAARKKASPQSCVYSCVLRGLLDGLARGTDSMPRLGPHPRANSTNTLRRCWNATLTPAGFSGSAPSYTQS